jgi:Na+-transporting NADH:ubiquinone oxidoreductase subunit C
VAWSNGYIFGFATAVCVVCSLAVATASTGLRDLQETNKRRDAQGSILFALGLPEDGSEPDGETIDKLWAERVKVIVVNGQGATLEGAAGDKDGDGDTDLADVDVARAAVKGTTQAPEVVAVYQRMDGAKVGAYAIPLYGMGLWGPVSGFLALAPDGQSVIGSTFFAPKETPGLGAEIAERPFQAQWVGKKVADKGKGRAIRVVKGKAADLCPGAVDYCVDGVSGATITMKGVDAMVGEAIETIYEPYLAQVRTKGNR